MSNGILHNELFLGSPALPDLGFEPSFATKIDSIKVVKRYPASGLPPAGISMSLDIEVSTERNLASGFFCPDALIVARDPLTHKILGYTKVITSALSGCSGTGHLVLDPSFRPTHTTTIDLEGYGSGVEPDKTASYQPVKVVPVQIGIDYQKGLQTGTYAKPTTSAVSSFFDHLSGGGLTKGITTVLVVGVIGYLIVINGPAIKKIIGSATNHFTKKKAS